MTLPAITQIFNQEKYQSFVSPHLVQRLLEAGLETNNIDCCWRIEDNKMYEMVCTWFDKDDYYRSAQHLIDSIIPPRAYWPAFQLRHMEQLLPDFIVQREGGHYTIAIDSMYKVEAVTDIRLPDAFAIMVLDCMRSRIIRPQDAIKMFNTT